MSAPDLNTRAFALAIGVVPETVREWVRTDSPGEVVAGPAPVSRHPSLVEREHDPLVVEACRVAAAHPDVMRRLRADPELFGQIIDALDATKAERAERARKATS